MIMFQVATCFYHTGHLHSFICYKDINLYLQNGRNWLSDYHVSGTQTRLWYLKMDKTQV
jgi:hypothetical protein